MPDALEQLIPLPDAPDRPAPSRNGHGRRLKVLQLTDRVGTHGGAEHLTRDAVFAAPDWSLEEAASAMVRGGFRHLIVLERGETTGILSVRDVVRCWTEDGAICAVPASAAMG